MSRFAVFVDDNESEISSIDGEQMVLNGSIEFDDSTLDIQKSEIGATDSENGVGYPSLTAGNLAYNSFVPIRGGQRFCEAVPDQELIKAREVLFSLMKNHSKVAHPKMVNGNLHLEMKINRADRFTGYMSEKSQKFFTEFYNENDGDYQGTTASITSWKYSKSQDGKPIYLYIVTIEGYGSCSGCDGYYSLDEDFSYLESLISMKYGNMSKLTPDQKREIISKSNESLYKMRELVNQCVIDVFSTIRLFRTYNEAAKFIRNMGDFKPPSFRNAFLRAFPQKKVISKKKEMPSLDSEVEFPPMKNVKPLGPPPGFDLPLAPTLRGYIPPSVEDDPYGVVAFLNL